MAETRSEIGSQSLTGTETETGPSGAQIHDNQYPKTEVSVLLLL